MDEAANAVDAKATVLPAAVEEEEEEDAAATRSERMWIHDEEGGEDAAVGDDDDDGEDEVLDRRRAFMSLSPTYSQTPTPPNHCPPLRPPAPPLPQHPPPHRHPPPPQDLAAGVRPPLPWSQNCLIWFFVLFLLNSLFKLLAKRHKRESM